MPMLQPFADALNATLPSDRFEDFSPALEDLLGASGFVAELDGLWRHPLTDGTVKLRRKYTVLSLGVSGASLGALRTSGSFPELLSLIGEGYHRVSGLHVAYDVPTAAPAVLRRAYRKGKAGLVTLTRKAVPSSQVRTVLSAGVIDAADTGTVYLGDRKRDVSLVVYDKRQELLEKAVKLHGDSPSVIAANDPGPLTRHELRLGRHAEVTLRDVYDPLELFWHFMGSSGLLPRPPGVPAWTSRALGFSVPRSEPDLMRQLDLLLEASPDIHRMLRLSDRMSREGRGYLLGRLRRLDVSARRIGQAVSAAAESSSPPGPFKALDVQV